MDITYHMQLLPPGPCSGVVLRPPHEAKCDNVKTQIFDANISRAPAHRRAAPFVKLLVYHATQREEQPQPTEASALAPTAPAEPRLDLQLEDAA